MTENGWTEVGEAADSVHVLYVGGVGRSGSTLLHLMLGQQPDYFAAGEVTHLWDRGVRDNQQCGCGQSFGSCPFWSGVGEAAFGGWQSIDIDRVIQLRNRASRFRHMPRLYLARRRGRADPDSAAYVEYLDALFTGIRDVSGAEVIVDSSKNPAPPLLMDLSTRLRVRVIHLVRDSRGVAYSRTKLVERPDGGTAPAHMGRFPPAFTATLWMAFNTAFEAMRWTTIPVIRIGYERVVDRPGEVLSALTNRSAVEGFETSTTMRLGENHAVAGNPMRMRRGDVELRRDDAWRGSLPNRARRIVTAVSWPLLLRYGYRLGYRS